MAPAVLQTCVVCGAQSHRTDWINRVNGFVACDFHSRDAVAQAVAKATAPKAAAPPLAPTPVAKAATAAVQAPAATPVKPVAIPPATPPPATK